MNSLQNIGKALITAYLEIGLNLPTGYETRDFNPDPSTHWAAVYTMFTDGRPVTMGTDGEDSYQGIFQVQFGVPEGTGVGQLHEYADRVLEFFKAGRRFDYDGQLVRVSRASPSRVYKSPTSASFIINVSVYWDSRSQR